MYTDRDEQMARETVAATLRDLSISIADFSRLQRRNVVNRWSLERILRNERGLDRNEAEALQELCQELRDLANAFPIPVNWSETATVQGVLAQRREQTRQLTALNSKTPLPIIEPQPVSHSVIDKAVSEIHPR